MTSARLLLLVPAASLLLAVSAGAGACSSSAAFSFSATAPEGDEFPVAIGSTCTGVHYYEATSGTGYEVCEEGAWAYTDDDPTTDGFSQGPTLGGSFGGNDGGGVTITPEPIPSGVTFPEGVVVGGDCTGDVYVDAETGAGYLVCDDGVWAFSTDLPSGYTEFAPSTGFDGGSGFGDSGTGFDSGETDGGSAFGDASFDAGSSDSGEGEVDGGPADTGVGNG